MPDDRNFFDDDDNLIPDWMRAMEPGAFDEPDDDAAPADGPPAPWETQPDEGPVAPQEPGGSAPWERSRSEGEPAPPDEPLPAPWEDQPRPEADEPSPWDLLEEPAPVGDFDDFDWTAFEDEPPAPAVPAAAEPFPWEAAAPPGGQPESLAEEPDADEWWRDADALPTPPTEPTTPPQSEDVEPLTPPEDEGEPEPDLFDVGQAPTLDDLEALFAAQAAPPDEDTVPPPLESRPRTGALRWLDEYGPAPDDDAPSVGEEAALPGAIPDWLRSTAADETGDEIAAPPAGQEVAPWLRTTDEAPAPPGADDASAWDADAGQPAAEDVPDWFRALDREEAQEWDDLTSDAPSPRESGQMPAAELPSVDWATLEDAAQQSEPEDRPIRGLDFGGEPTAGDDASDFVERFDPFEPDDFPAAQAPPGEEVPDWLRDMAGAVDRDAAPSHESPSFFDELPDIVPPPGTAAVADEDEMDWLAAIDAEAVQPRAEPSDVQPDFGWPADSVFDHEDLDSSAIDDLLSLAADDAASLPPFTDVEGYEAFVEDEQPEEPQAAEAEPVEISGVPDPFAQPGDEVPDLGALLASSGFEAGDVPDLQALWSDADQSLADVFAQDSAPAGELPVDEPPSQAPAAPPPAAPGGRFRWRRRQPAEELPAPPRDEGTEPLPPVEEPQPEWVEELRPSEVPVTIKAGGAEANIRQRHVAELPERLRTFREEVMRELGDAPATRATEEALFPADLLAPGESGPLVEGLVVTRAQQARVDKLRALLEAAAEDEAADSGPGVAGLPAWAVGDITPGLGAPPPALPKRQRRARRLRADRLLVTLLLLLGVLAPFATDTVFFAADPAPLSGDAAAVARRVNALGAGDYVLFAFEYGPMSAGVLDALAHAVLRDALAQGAIPLTISTNPAGAFHATAVLGALTDDAGLLAARGAEENALVAGEDYALLRYLPGEAVGVRALSGVLLGDGELLPHPAFERDLRGEATDLSIRSADADLALIVVISDDSGAVRTWAEQLQDVAVPMVALVTEAVAPLTVPYVSAGAYAGYLAGVRDTYRYDAARNANTRTPFTLPEDLPIDLPEPAESRWHSMALGAAVAAGLIAVGALLNLLRGIPRRRRR